MATVQIKTDGFAMQGGVDYTTSPLLMKSGALLDSLNYEIDSGNGYVRIGGFDRWNGSTCPEMMALRVCVVEPAIELQCAPGLQIVGMLSGARMTLRKLDRSIGGEYISTLLPSTNEVLIVSDVVGVFIEGENAFFLGGEQGALRIVSPPAFERANSAKELAQAEADLRAKARKMIESPGQSLLSRAFGANRGAVLGVLMFEGETIAFKASLTDKDRIGVYKPALFDDQSNIPLTQWREVGPLPSPVAGARMEFVEYNFLGNSSNNRLYGVTGTGKAFEYGGDVLYREITTEYTDDRPTHVCVHLNRLVLAIGEEVVVSQEGNPFGYDATLFAFSKICGSRVTGLLSLQGSDNSSALLIGTEKTTLIMFGDLSVTDGIVNFRFVDLGVGTGIIEWSMQNIGQPVFATDFGLSALSTVNAFGGFRMSSISEAVSPFFNQRKRKVTASVVCRNRNQYRIFFDDGYALYITFKGNELRGIMPVNLKKVVTSASSVIDYGGREMTLIGTQDGGVYLMDVGRSFDGEPIYFMMATAYNNLRSPRVQKRFRRVSIEVETDGFMEFAIEGQFDYSSPLLPHVKGDLVETDTTVATGFDRVRWDDFQFDASFQSPLVVDMQGRGENMAIVVQGRSNHVDAFRVTGAVIQYNALRNAR